MLEDEAQKMYEKKVWKAFLIGALVEDTKR
jgi:hypothetical protein